MNKQQLRKAIEAQEEIKTQAQAEMTKIETTDQGWEDWNDWSDKFDDAVREIRRLDLSQYQNSRSTYNVR